MTGTSSFISVRSLYDRFDAPVTPFDCGKKCAPHNPSGKPFCCDICHAVPAAYHQEWEYVRQNTDLWHIWRGDECTQDPDDPAALQAETPESMQLLACKGPAHCQREYRLVSCRQFPFSPFILSDGRFIGLAYAWDFEPTCWVISHLGEVTQEFREQFVRTYDELFELWPAEFQSYYIHSEEMRTVFTAKKRRIPILHRRGGFYLLSPRGERLQRISPERLQRHGMYRNL
jgi:hypothetical protein